MGRQKKKNQQQLDQWLEPDCGNYKSHDPVTLTIPPSHTNPPFTPSPLPLLHLFHQVLEMNCSNMEKKFAAQFTAM